MTAKLYPSGKSCDACFVASCWIPSGAGNTFLKMMIFCPLWSPNPFFLSPETVNKIFTC